MRVRSITSVASFRLCRRFECRCRLGGISSSLRIYAQMSSGKAAKKGMLWRTRVFCLSISRQAWKRAVNYVGRAAGQTTFNTNLPSTPSKWPLIRIAIASHRTTIQPYHSSAFVLQQRFIKTTTVEYPRICPLHTQLKQYGFVELRMEWRVGILNVLTLYLYHQAARMLGRYSFK